MDLRALADFKTAEPVSKRTLHGYRELSPAGHHVRVRNRWGKAVGLWERCSADASLATPREADYRRITDRRNGTRRYLQPQRPEIAGSEISGTEHMAKQNISQLMKHSLVSSP